MISKWLDADSIDYLIATAYSAGKGKLFGIFFGWRECNQGKSKITLSKQDWEEIKDLTEYYKNFIEKN